MSIHSRMPKVPAPPTTSDLPRSASKRERILRAAVEVFAQNGYFNAKVSEIAKSAGVADGTIYLYFDGKEALFEAAVLAAMDRIFTPSEQRVEQHTGAAESLLVELMRRWWKAVALDPRLAALPVLVEAESDRFPQLARHYVEQVLERGCAMWQRVLQRGIDQGEFRPHDTALAARLLIAPALHAFAHNWSLARYSEGSAFGKDYLDLHLDVFLRGIRTQSSVDGLPG